MTASQELHARSSTEAAAEEAQATRRRCRSDRPAPTTTTSSTPRSSTTRASDVTSTRRRPGAGPIRRRRPAGTPSDADLGADAGDPGTAGAADEGSADGAAADDDLDGRRRRGRGRRSRRCRRARRVPRRLPPGEGRLRELQEAHAKQHADTVERAAEKLVDELLPVLDACEAAWPTAPRGVEPDRTSRSSTSSRRTGLVRMTLAGEPFDPTWHDAVLHEPTATAASPSQVRRDPAHRYRWRRPGLRPAMVKVRELTAAK